MSGSSITKMSENAQFHISLQTCDYVFIHYTRRSASYLDLFLDKNTDGRLKHEYMTNAVINISEQ